MKGMPNEEILVPLRSVEAQFDNDDPAYRPGSPATYLVLALCYDGLTGPQTGARSDGLINPDFATMQPRLATAWRSDAASRLWTVSLRRDARSGWGNPLTAETVKWGFEKAFDVDNIAAWRWRQVAGLDGPHTIEIIDGSTLRFSLRRPDPFFPSRLFHATPNLVDAATVTRHATPADPWGMDWLASNAAGFGPFTLDEVDSDRIRFRSVATYWSANAPDVDAIAVRVASRHEALSMLDGPGQVFVPGLRPDEFRSVVGRGGARTVGAWAGHASIEIGHNQPPFSDRRVRQALASATPYDEVIESGFRNLARRWKGPLKTYTPWYADAHSTQETDPDAARKLLKDAGWGAGFETELWIPDRPDALHIGEIVQKAFGAVGIGIVLRDLADAPPGWMPPLHLRLDCGHNITEPLYDLAHDFAPLSPINPPGGRIGVGTWTPRYVGDPRLEDMYRMALDAPSTQERRSRTLELQQAIIDFVPAIFLAEQPLFNATNSPHDWFVDPQARLNQVILFQNANSNYLPAA